jgi:hypothetical protein
VLSTSEPVAAGSAKRWRFAPQPGIARDPQACAGRLQLERKSGLHGTFKALGLHVVVVVVVVVVVTDW